jgi:hypothetical protein
MQHDSKNNMQNIHVGIFKTKNAYRAEILPTIPSPMGEEGGGEEEVIYIRTFSEVVLAIGYRDVLNKLSKKSVEQLMTINNEPHSPLPSPIGEGLGVRSYY